MLALAHDHAGCVVAGFEDFRIQPRQVRRIVLAVCIEKTQPAIARRVGAAAHGGALPALRCVPDNSQSRAIPFELGEHRLGFIPAAVVHYDQFPEGTPGKGRIHASDQRRKTGGFVVGRRHHRNTLDIHARRIFLY